MIKKVNREIKGGVEDMRERPKIEILFKGQFNSVGSLLPMFYFYWLMNKAVCRIMDYEWIQCQADFVYTILNYPSQLIFLILATNSDLFRRMLFFLFDINHLIF